MGKYFEYFKIACRLLSIGWAGAETIVLLQYAWWRAFFYGLATGKYTVLIDINSFGEANAEMVLWIIITPIIIYGSYLNIIPIIRDFDKIYLKNLEKEG
jgi:hypothetical protein